MKKIMYMIFALSVAVISLKTLPRTTKALFPTDKKYFFVNETREVVKVCCFFGKTSDINPVCQDVLPHYKTFFASPECLKYFIVAEAYFPYFNPLDDYSDICTDKTFYIRYYDEPNRKITVEVEGSAEENNSIRGEGAQ